jgi:hypothetical protein
VTKQQKTKKQNIWLEMDRFRKKVERDLANINSNEDEEGTSGSGKVKSK